VKRLKEEKGVAPGQVIDMLTLMGDSVDNVPGVEGVGPKTAAELISQWGTLDNLLAHAGEIKGKRGEKLREAAPRLGLSKQLVTLRHDAPVALPLDTADVSRLRLERLMPILKELGFNRYQEELKTLIGETPSVQAAEAMLSRSQDRGSTDSHRESAARGVEAPVTGGLFDHVPRERPAFPAAGDYRCVRTRGDLDDLVRRLREAEIFALDTETTGLSPRRAKLCGLSFAVRPGEAWYVPVRSPDPASHLDERTILEALRPLIEDPARAKCGHNLKYDLMILRSHGVEIRGGSGRLFDSMTASFLIDSSRSSHSLDNLCLALLGHKNISITELIGTGKDQRTFDTVPLDAATTYAAEDADMSLRLRDVMLPQLRAMHLMDLFERVEMPLVEVLAELEWNGIIVDPAELDRQAARLNRRIDELRRAIRDASPREFNPDSPKQLAEALFHSPQDDPPGLGIKPLKRTKTGYSTDVEVLEKLALDPEVKSPVPGLIVEYRQLTKLVGTYLTALKAEINPETKRVHSSFNQTGAATGRLSSSDPNLQNIPIRTDIGREIRKAFVAPPGSVLISADYSQIELRLLAHLSRDPALTEAFRRGDDIHAAVAAQIHGVPLDQVTKEQRNGAKMVNFGIVYGVTPFGLARRLGISNEAAGQIIDGYKRRFAGITTFLEECIAQAQRFGYVETMLKRRRPITGIESKNPAERALAERVAINSVVQGSAADLIKLAMVDLHARLSEHAGHRRIDAEDAAATRSERAESSKPRMTRPEASTRTPQPRRPEDEYPPPEIPGVKMLLQIHDELVFEAPRDVAERARSLIVERMESAMSLSVPLKVEASISGNWFEGK
jgi:DNA polymerase-1